MSAVDESIYQDVSYEKIYKRYQKISDACKIRDFELAKRLLCQETELFIHKNPQQTTIMKIIQQSGYIFYCGFLSEKYDFLDFLVQIGYDIDKHFEYSKMDLLTLEHTQVKTIENLKQMLTSIRRLYLIKLIQSQCEYE